MIFFLFCMLISNVHKSVIVINSIDTPFSRNVFEVVCVIICGLKSLAFGGYFHLPSVPCAFFGVIVSFPASKFSYLGE